VLAASHVASVKDGPVMTWCIPPHSRPTISLNNTKILYDLFPNRRLQKAVAMAQGQDPITTHSEWPRFLAEEERQRKEIWWNLCSDVFLRIPMRENVFDYESSEDTKDLFLKNMFVPSSVSEIKDPNLLQFILDSFLISGNRRISIRDTPNEFVKGIINPFCRKHNLICRVEVMTDVRFATCHLRIQGLVERDRKQGNRWKKR
jgi:hypothetical protein